MPRTLNATFFILIPKVKKLISFNHYRPISLCNFTYKIVSRILSNRLSPPLCKFVSPNQGVFIKGHWIAKHTILAQEVVHKVKQHKGHNGLMILKLDIMKAYDCLEWSFLHSTLTAWVSLVELQIF